MSTIFRSEVSINNKKFEYGGWGQIWVTVRFGVVIEIFDAPEVHDGATRVGKLTCNLNYANATFEEGIYEDGGGFWNSAGIMWGNGSYTTQSYPFDLDTEDDSWNKMVDDMTAFTSDYAIAFGFCDSGSKSDIANSFGTLNSPRNNFSRWINPSEIDSSGNLRPLLVAMTYHRFYHYGDDMPVSKVEVWRWDDLYTNDKDIHVDWKYYPWAVKDSSNVWQSCNRQYPSSVGDANKASLRLKRSGNDWLSGEVLNTMQPDAQTPQHAWVKQNGNWKASPAIGNGA